MKHLLIVGLLAGCTLTPTGVDTFGPAPGTTSRFDDEVEGETSSSGRPASDSTSGASTSPDASSDSASPTSGSTGVASTGGVLDGGASTGSAEDSSTTATTDPAVAETWPEFSATCSSGPLSTHLGDALADPELIIVGVYEPTDTEIDVVLDRPGPGIILVLSSYEPTHWVLDVAEGTNLQEVILNGYYHHTVQGEGAAPVTDLSGPGSYIEACGYVYPDDGGGCHIDELIDGAESLAGADLTAFGGCYEASFLFVQ